MNLPIANASPAEIARVKWHLMRNVEQDRNREALLKNDQKEVLYEMIIQDCQDGKTHQQAADEYRVNKSTVWRITRRRKVNG